MNSWDFYNACFEIATRCTTIYCKSFIYNVVRESNRLIISAESSCKDGNRDEGLNIWMEGNKAKNSLTISVCDMGTGEKESREDYDEIELNALVFAFGKDIASSFLIDPNSLEFTLFFDESKSYDIYKHRYQYLVGGKKQENEESDYPLPNYLKTEFENEVCFSHENSRLITEVQKDGVPLFNERLLQSSCDSWGVIRVEKDTSGFLISTDGELFNDPYKCRKVMSYIGNLAYTEMLWLYIPTLPQKKGEKPRFEFFFSETKYAWDDIIIRLERFRSYGIHMWELKGALTMLSEQLKTPKIDWAKSKMFY